MIIVTLGWLLQRVWPFQFQPQNPRAPFCSLPRALPHKYLNALTLQPSQIFMGYICFQKLLIDKCGKQIYNWESLTFSSNQHSHEWKYQGFFTVFSKPWNTVSSVPAWRVSLVWCPSSQVSADMSLLFGVPRTPQCPPLTVLPECPVSTLPQTFPVFAHWVPACQTYVTDHSTLWSSATKLCILDIHLIHIGKTE